MRKYGKGKFFLLLLFLETETMDGLKLYEINPKYVTYLLNYAPHLFRNSSPEQHNSRKYIGVVFRINGFDYFAPLSSFKVKHRKMQESIDFIKIKDYAVINLNNMFPVPMTECAYVDINSQRDMRYKALLLTEYRYIKSIQDKIRKNARNVYKIKLRDGNSSSLAKRCNDFLALEEACRKYMKSK